MSQAPRILPNGAIATRDFGNSFDDVFDELHSTSGDASGGTASEEETKRWEAEFLAGLSQEVNNRLRSTTMRVFKASVDMSRGESFLIELTDTEDRYFTVTLPLDVLMETKSSFGDNFGEQIITSVVNEALAQRAKYFARMQ